MKSAVHWAETPLGIPYEAPDATALNMQYAKSVAGKCALTGLFAAIGVFGTLSLTKEPPPVPVVVLADYEPPPDMVAPTQIVRAAPLPAPAVPKSPVAAAPVPAPAISVPSVPGMAMAGVQSGPAAPVTPPISMAPNEPALTLRSSQKAGRAPEVLLATPKATDAPAQNAYVYLEQKQAKEASEAKAAAARAEAKKLAAEAAAAKSALAAAKAKPEPKATPGVVAAQAGRPSEDNDVSASAAAKAQASTKQNKVAAVAPPAKSAAPMPSERSNKPVDIASAAKFSLLNYSAAGLTLYNGTTVPVGSRLPNGEIVQHIDPAKGRIETDQRIMMVTP